MITWLLPSSTLVYKARFLFWMLFYISALVNFLVTQGFLQEEWVHCASVGNWYAAPEYQRFIVVSNSCDTMDCSLPGFSVHGIFQARILECVAISISMGSSWPMNQTRISHTADRLFTIWATREIQKTQNVRYLGTLGFSFVCKFSLDQTKPTRVKIYTVFLL